MLSARPQGRPPKLVTAHGRTQTLLAWSRELGQSSNTLLARLKRMRPDDAMQRRRLRGTLGRCAKSLPEMWEGANELPWEDDDRCWYVVAQHPEGLTQEQIGEVLGVNRRRVEQIEHVALAKLTRAITEQGLGDELRAMLIERIAAVDGKETVLPVSDGL